MFFELTKDSQQASERKCKAAIIAAEALIRNIDSFCEEHELDLEVFKDFFNNKDNFDTEEWEELERLRSSDRERLKMLEWNARKKECKRPDGQWPFMCR